MAAEAYTFNWKQVFISIGDVNKENVMDKLKKALEQDMHNNRSNMSNESYKHMSESSYRKWQNSNFDINFIFYDFECAQIDIGTLLHMAVINSNVQAARALVEAGADTEAVNSCWHSTPLGIATIKNNVKMAEALIEKGAKVDIRVQQGQTPLHIFSKCDQVGIINDLIAKAPDKVAYVNTVDMNKFAPLHIAVEHKRIDVIKALMASGANPLLKTQYSKEFIENFKKNYEQGHIENKYDFLQMIGCTTASGIAVIATLGAIVTLFPVVAVGGIPTILGAGASLCTGGVTLYSCEKIKNRKLEQWLKEFEAKNNNKTPRELADSEEIRKLIDTERQKYLNGLRGQAHSVSPATIIEIEEIHEQKKREKQ